MFCHCHRGVWWYWFMVSHCLSQVSGSGVSHLKPFVHANLVLDQLEKGEMGHFRIQLCDWKIWLSRQLRARTCLVGECCPKDRRRNPVTIRIFVALVPKVFTVPVTDLSLLITIYDQPMPEQSSKLQLIRLSLRSSHSIIGCIPF